MSSIPNRVVKYAHVDSRHFYSERWSESDGTLAKLYRTLSGFTTLFTRPEDGTYVLTLTHEDSIEFSCIDYVRHE